MARDLIHDAVKTALINDNWQVTDDPFSLKLIEGDKILEVDMGAEKIFAAEKAKERILVEVKTFGGTSILNKFHEALGQFLDYRDAMEEANVDRVLFLAVSESVFIEINKINFLKRRIVQYRLNFIVVDLDAKEITKWIK